MTKLDLNKAFTTRDVQLLIAAKDDSQNRQLRVDCDGIAYISDEFGNTNDGCLAFKLETWMKGNSYVGVEASNDSKYVARVESVLRDNWPKPKSFYIDDY